jgi:hypothetical protein
MTSTLQCPICTGPHVAEDCPLARAVDRAVEEYKRKESTALAGRPVRPEEIADSRPERGAGLRGSEKRRRPSRPR